MIRWCRLDGKTTCSQRRHRLTNVVHGIFFSIKLIGPYRPSGNGSHSECAYRVKYGDPHSLVALIGFFGSEQAELFPEKMEFDQYYSPQRDVAICWCSDWGVGDWRLGYLTHYSVWLIINLLFKLHQPLFLQEWIFAMRTHDQSSLQFAPAVVSSFYRPGMNKYLQWGLVGRSAPPQVPRNRH